MSRVSKLHSKINRPPYIELNVVLLFTSGDFTKTIIRLTLSEQV